MPSEYFNIPNSLITKDAGTHARQVCFPKKIDCFPTCDTWLKSESSLHNCNVKKKIHKHINPYVKGDKLHFQTRFFDKYNTNPETPTSGWGTFMKAEILDFDGNVIESTIANFASDYIVAWNGSYSYQIIVVDTSLFPQDSWHIRIWAENQSGTVTEELYSEPFYREITDCSSVVYFESSYTNEDCCGNYYREPLNNDSWVGTSLFQYSNRTAFLGTIMREVGTMTYTKFNDTVTESVFQTPWTFRPKKPIPLYLSDFLLRTIMGGQQKKVNGNNVLVDDLAPSNILEKGGNTFYYDLNFYSECTVDFYCG